MGKVRIIMLGIKFKDNLLYCFNDYYIGELLKLYKFLLVWYLF